MKKNLLRSIVTKALHSSPLRGARHRLFLRRRVPMPAGAIEREVPIRVLVLGVFLADRANSVDHLVQAFASAQQGLRVEQRWVALNGSSERPQVRDVTVLVATRPEPKFALLNRLLRPSDPDEFDFIIACDDDIYLQRGFLPAYIAYQQKFDFAVAQPSRAWHSHFDHSFVLRRPWLQARQTRFVECGPLVSLRKDAARLLLPFDQQDEMWGIDLVWAALTAKHGLRMGIVDALSVDHSLRPQASTYDKTDEEAAMNRYLSNRPHVPMDQVFTVVKRYPLR